MKVDTKMIEEVWNQHAYHYDEVHNAAEDVDAWCKTLDDLLCHYSNRHILDIGTGTGFLVFLLTQMGFQCSGVDLAGRMLRTAREYMQNGNQQIQLARADWEKLPYADHSYDVLVNRCILWALFNPEKTLSEWMRVLKPGGQLLCFLPVGKETEGPAPDHYAPHIEAQLSLKGAGPAKLTAFLSTCGYQTVEDISLPEIKETPLFSRWYVIRAFKQQNIFS